MHSLDQSEFILGLTPAWFAGILFVLTYVLIISERLNRAVIALMAACIMIVSGILTQEAAIQGIDFNTIGLLTGMMIIVSITRRSGIFIRSVRATSWWYSRRTISSTTSMG